MAETERQDANIIKTADEDQLAHKAFEIFKEDAKRSIESKGTFRVAVSGGHTPEKFFHLLSNDKDDMWQHVHIFWVDERYVPPTDENSNYHLAEITFLNQVPMPKENIHRIPTEAKDYHLAAAQYEATIMKVFSLKPGQVPKFDLMILGMGSDGHVGSLLPNTTSLFETEHLTSVVYVMDDKLNRITLTSPVMRAADHLMVLLTGSAKAEIAKAVFSSEPDELKYPIHTLWPILDKITWLLDNEAGKLL